MTKKMKIFVYSVFAFAIVGVLFTASFAVKGASSLFSQNNYSMRDNQTHMNSNSYHMNTNSHCN